MIPNEWSPWRELQFDFMLSNISNTKSTSTYSCRHVLNATTSPEHLAHHINQLHHAKCFQREQINEEIIDFTFSNDRKSEINRGKLAIYIRQEKKVT